jgi:hypothetical protein
MADQKIEQSFKSVLDRTWRALKAHGFQKQGQRFRRRDGSTVAIVEFQRSQANDNTAIKFTLNLGVVSVALANRIDPEQDLGKAVVADAHLRQRIGTLLASGQDHWWQVTAATDGDALATEVAKAVENLALPYIAKFRRDECLVDLWKSDQSPGLTAGQRERYLDLLAS